MHLMKGNLLIQQADKVIHQKEDRLIRISVQLVREGKYESEGYHDFDGPMYQNTSTNMGSNQGIHAEELKKGAGNWFRNQEKFSEVPKTREEFRKKNQRKPQSQ